MEPLNTGIRLFAKSFLIAENVDGFRTSPNLFKSYIRSTVRLKRSKLNSLDLWIRLRFSSRNMIVGSERQNKFLLGESGEADSKRPILQRKTDSVSKTQRFINRSSGANKLSIEHCVKFNHCFQASTEIWFLKTRLQKYFYCTIHVRHYWKPTILSRE